VTRAAHLSDPAHQHSALGIAYRVSAMACMAVLAAIVKWTGQHGMPVFEIIFFRNTFAFIPLGLWIWRTTGPLVLKTSRPLGHLIRSGIGLCGMVCGFSAIQHLALTEATALNFASPLFMTALSALVLGERVGRHRWGAVVVGFVGVLIMVSPNPASLGPASLGPASLGPGHLNLLGVSLALGGALCSAGAMVAVRQIAATEKGPTIVFYFTAAGAVMGLAGSLVHWVTPDALTLGLLILGGLIGGVGQLFLTEAIRVAPVGVVAPFDYTQLVWATGLGFLVWGELPHAATLAGALIVAASGVYIIHRELVRRRVVASAVV
jgi:drug/metabolite transporter (DMT)-like permease